MLTLFCVIGNSASLLRLADGTLHGCLAEVRNFDHRVLCDRKVPHNERAIVGRRLINGP